MWLVVVPDHYSPDTNGREPGWNPQPVQTQLQQRISGIEPRFTGRLARIYTNYTAHDRHQQQSKVIDFPSCNFFLWLSEVRVSQSQVLCKFISSIAEDEVTAQVSVAAMFQTSIMQVPGSHLGPDTDYPDLVVRGFYYSLSNIKIYHRLHHDRYIPNKFHYISSLSFSPVEIRRASSKTRAPAHTNTQRQGRRHSLFQFSFLIPIFLSCTPYFFPHLVN